MVKKPGPQGNKKGKSTAEGIAITENGQEKY